MVGLSKLATLLDVEPSKIKSWVDAGVLEPKREPAGTEIQFSESESHVANMFVQALSRRVLMGPPLVRLASFLRSALTEYERTAEEQEVLVAAQTGVQKFLTVRVVEEPITGRAPKLSICASAHPDLESANRWLENNQDALSVIEI